MEWSEILLTLCGQSLVGWFLCSKVAESNSMLETQATGD